MEDAGREILRDDNDEEPVTVLRPQSGKEIAGRAEGVRDGGNAGVCG